MSQAKWTEVIKPTRSLFDIHVKELWEYRDLLVMFVKRDYSASYKQTILGPLWHLIQPIFPTIIFTFAFGKIARISTDQIPAPLFYLSGLLFWNYFLDCYTRTSNVFVSNANIFGKVYFPRLILPVSFTISSLMRFVSQLVLFVIAWVYYLVTQPEHLQMHAEAFLFPVLVLLMAGFALGAGLIVSSLSSRYRDLSILITFFVSLLQYATCVIYPVSAVPEKYRHLVLLNPLTPVIESFRYAFLGSGHFSYGSLLYSFVFMVILIVVGILSFNKVERTFMDTV